MSPVSRRQAAGAGACWSLLEQWRLHPAAGELHRDIVAKTNQHLGFTAMFESTPLSCTAGEARFIPAAVQVPPCRERPKYCAINLGIMASHLPRPRGKLHRDGLGGLGPGRGAPLRGARLFSWLPVSRRGSRDVFGGDGTFRQGASMVAYIQGFGNSILCNL